MMRDLEAENADLRAQVVRLTGERDQSRALVEILGPLCDSAGSGGREIASLRARLAASEQTVTRLASAAAATAIDLQSRDALATEVGRLTWQLARAKELQLGAEAQAVHFLVNKQALIARIRSALGLA